MIVKKQKQKRIIKLLIFFKQLDNSIMMMKKVNVFQCKILISNEYY